AGLRAGQRAVVDESGALAVARGHVPVEAVPGSVADRAGKPPAVDAERGVENLVPGLLPVDRARGFAPEAFRIGLPGGIDLGIAAHRVLPRQTGVGREFSALAVRNSSMAACHFRLHTFAGGRRAISSCTPSIPSP